MKERKCGGGGLLTMRSNDSRYKLSCAELYKIPFEIFFALLCLVTCLLKLNKEG